MRIYVQPSAKTSCASDWVVSFVHIPCICNSVYISASCLAPVKGMAGILAGLLALLGPTIQSAEWEFAQSLPTESYVVIGRVLRVCQKSRIGEWEFSRTLPTANHIVIGRVLRLCEEIGE